MKSVQGDSIRDIRKWNWLIMKTPFYSILLSKMAQLSPLALYLTSPNSLLIGNGLGGFNGTPKVD